MPKRSDGALEHEVMAVLWNADGELTPGSVQSQLAGDLAYTTVATILTRLHAKGLVSRREYGRGFTYRPATTESQLTSRKLSLLLEGANDRRAVLAGFVDGLSPRDTAALRGLLAGD